MTVNGQKSDCPIVDDFLQIARVMKAGDLIEVQFKQVAGEAPLLRPERTPGFHRYMHGPLVLGADTAEEKKLPKGTQVEPQGHARYKSGEITLAPLCDLTDRRDTVNRARNGSIQVLFRD